MFANDRDLLVLEPYLFRDHAWVGQRLSRGQGSVSANVITMDSSDVELDAAQVQVGGVATYLGTSFEIIGGITIKNATISKVRASTAAPTIATEDTATVDIAFVSFRPQIALVHRQILRMAGIEPDVPAPAAGRLGENAITNGASLATLEAFGALHLIFAAAASVAGPSSPAMARAQMYRDLFREERQRATVELDTDADGLPDVARRLNAAQFIRG